MPGATISEIRRRRNTNRCGNSRDWGFEINPLMVRAKSVEELVAHYQLIEAQRSSLGYDIDGVVYKVDQLDLQRALGLRLRRAALGDRPQIPGRAGDDDGSQGIDIQVGRTGTLAPVARLAPVTVGGVVVDNVTLHNEDYIEGLDSNGQPIREGSDIRIGDTVRDPAGRRRHPADRRASCSEKRPADARALRVPARSARCLLHAATRESATRRRQGGSRRCTGELICAAQAVERSAISCRAARWTSRGSARKQSTCSSMPTAKTLPTSSVRPRAGRHLFTREAQARSARRRRASSREGRSAVERTYEGATSCLPRSTRGASRARPLHLRARHPPYRRDDGSGSRALPDLLDHRSDADPRRQGDGGRRRSGHGCCRRSTASATRSIGALARFLRQGAQRRGARCAARKQVIASRMW